MKRVYVERWNGRYEVILRASYRRIAVVAARVRRKDADAVAKALRAALKVAPDGKKK